ncbi:hypothetical protein [Ralstonia pseudosolanacearum]|uniref:hypothetical protein n=1 Tax=Ralstonia pseudosolanacearum TaxID=1310165 RepID=UPI000A73082F
MLSVAKCEMRRGAGLSRFDRFRKLTAQKKFASISILLLLGCASCFAAGSDISEKATSPRLAPFTYYVLASNPRDSDLHSQKANEVCKDFIGLINHPRSNEIFNEDGSLARESNKVKSVAWNTLNKDDYERGFEKFANTKSPKVSVDYKARYNDPRWLLQRTVAHPSPEYRVQSSQSSLWLYRLVLNSPHTREVNGSSGQIELPRWFPADSLSWVGDGHGQPSENDKYGGFYGFLQWIVHADTTYAVSNLTIADRAGEAPRYLFISVDKLIVFSDGPSHLRQSCAFRARNKE